MNPNSSWIDRVLGTLHPTLKLSRVDWKSQWQQLERQQFRQWGTIVWSVLGVLFFIEALGWFVERQDAFGAYSRFILPSCSLIALLWINAPSMIDRPHYKEPLAIFCLCVCFLHAKLINLSYPFPVNFIPFIIVPIIMTLFLRLSVGLSVPYLLISFWVDSFGLNNILDSFQIEMLRIFAAIGLVVVITIRTEMSKAIDLFLCQKTIAETQGLLQEKQTEVNEQIRTFLPKKIYRQVIQLVNERKLSMSQAMEEVIRPRSSIAACLYTDIRGFTKVVRRGQDLVLKTILPSQRTFSDIVQDHDGIPRITGDLVFAIFENDRSIQKSVQDALNCALEMIDSQKKLNLLNEDSTAHIKRYVLISLGQVVIGNTGGVDGSRDIAAYGDCANVLSRIDEVTKHKGIEELVSSQSIIFNSIAFDYVLTKIFPDISYREINLAEHGVELRDFPEERSIFLIDASDLRRKATEEAA
jgi:class 3 adenylate cyclase